MVTVLTFGYLYYKLFIDNNYHDLKQGFKFAYEPYKIPLLAGVLELMFINWALETVKWQRLMGKLEKLTFWHAYKAILAGVTVSFFTPNRVGEFMGRIIFLYKANKAKAILGTIVGSFAQLTCTIFFGAVSFAWILNHFTNIFGELGTEKQAITAAIVTLFIAVFIIVLYFNIGLLHKLMQRVKLKKIAKYTAILTRYKRNDLLSVLFISALRYMVFTTQYVMVLYFFDISFGVVDMFLAVSVIFLLQSSIPSLAFTELGNRGVIALFILELVANTNHLSILSAAYTLWAINIVMPSLIGLVFILQAKLYSGK